MAAQWYGGVGNDPTQWFKSTWSLTPLFFSLCSFFSVLCFLLRDEVFFSLNNTLRSEPTFDDKMDLASMFSELALIAIFLVSITTAFQNHTCYFPDGSVAQYGSLAFVQCKETSVDGVTHCCNPNDICTVAGYCVGGAGVFYRGGCTDKTWTSNLCPLLCATGATLLKNICSISDSWENCWQIDS